MTALSAARLTEGKCLGHKRRYLVKSGTTIYAGGMVMLNSVGEAVPAQLNLSSNKGCVGQATETVTGTGSNYVEVLEGTFRFAGTSLTQSFVGAQFYATDDQTLTDSSGSSAPKAGFLIEVISSTEAWVAMGPQFTL